MARKTPLVLRQVITLLLPFLCFVLSPLLFLIYPLFSPFSLILLSYTYLHLFISFFLSPSFLNTPSYLPFPTTQPTLSHLPCLDHVNGVLEEVSRDFNSNYMRAVEVVGDDEHFVGADDNGNLFVVRLSSTLSLYRIFLLWIDIILSCLITLTHHPIIPTRDCRSGSSSSRCRHRRRTW